MEEKNEPRAGVTILSFQKIAKTGRVQWAGHVVRMPDKNAVKIVFASNAAGTRRKGAQRARR